MRFRVVLTGAAALASGVAAGPSFNPHKIRQGLNKRDGVDIVNTEAKDTVLQTRECDIVCPLSKLWCEYHPYNYRCDSSGKLRYDQRHTDCENASWGCTCGCDWRVPGIESVEETKKA
ncbi:uncharacterized protein BDZ83DRAFT_397065 [Colletotrichum acutatum]|uniref:Uncharacterized protein n=1 Tax=Glomerella acutata TaxID=27357 RepID=A0AAD8XDH1_GLOAC|nr:uncharacterized protein BDZ83DRAFT_397065 [Colletotrichum acutatum]KAK1723147.1 hypothetical protein BDZ83DRAFT_397065 [Colletotrichum acutatum]